MPVIFQPLRSTEPCIWEVQGEVQQPTEAVDIRADGRKYHPLSYAVLCRNCGQVWAKRASLAGHKNNWSFKYINCRACGDGSLWLWYDESWNRSLGHENLKRELLLLGERYV